MKNINGPLKVGIGGPVGAGKTSLTAVKLVFPAPTGPPIPTFNGPFIFFMSYKFAFSNFHA